jgi:hypothetical protein
LLPTFKMQRGRRYAYFSQRVYCIVDTASHSPAQSRWTVLLYARTLDCERIGWVY